MSKSKYTKQHFWKLRIRNCTPLWREAHFEVDTVQKNGVRTTFGSSDVEIPRYCVANHVSKSISVKDIKTWDHLGGTDIPNAPIDAIKDTQIETDRKKIKGYSQIE